MYIYRKTLSHNECMFSILFGVLVFLCISIPVSNIMAQTTTTPVETTEEGLVPCGNNPDDPDDECNFDDLILTVQRVIDFMFKFLILPIAAIIFAWSGLKLLFRGDNPEARQQTKKMFWKVFVGLLIALSAWVIVSTIISGLEVLPGYSLLAD
jgi:ABC-type antimicrobial peptide transport system permease subunit